VLRTCCSTQDASHTVHPASRANWRGGADIASASLRHSHSIVPGGFEVMS
jgi:hypothetical protein